MEYFDLAETWSRDKIEATQVIRLRSMLERVQKCTFYRERLASAGISASNFTSLDQLSQIPFTTKEELRQQYPLGLLCIPKNEVVRMHCSSGTTGTPVAICHSKNDIDAWANFMARSFWSVGVRPDDVFQNMSGYGLFTGGLGIHYGAERLGCMTIPAGAGNSKRQIKLIKDFKTTVIHILPSYALILADQIKAMGEDPRDLPLRIAAVGAEPYTASYRKRIEDIFDLKAYNSYGLSEMSGPGVGFECQEQYGLHIWEDGFLPEIIDPETGKYVEEGEVGELVLTSLCREAMPILRYRTRDLTRFLPGECGCGRKHRRIDRILGRVDDMFILKGVNIYPMQIEKIIMSFPEVGKNYLITLENDGLTDILRLQVEIRAEFFTEDMRTLQDLQNRITKDVKNEILITPRVELVESNTLPCDEGAKAKRVLDKRDSK